VATAREVRQRFRHWRRRRPFWGGYLLLLAGVELFLSANLTLGDIEVHIGPQGFLSYLLPLILVLCGVLAWYTPAQRLFYGILGLLTALYSLLGLNLGGFFVGMLFGIIGGALTIAWAPVRLPPTETEIVPFEEPTPAPAEPADEHDPRFDEAPTQFLPGFSAGADEHSDEPEPAAPAAPERSATGRAAAGRAAVGPAADPAAAAPAVAGSATAPGVAESAAAPGADAPVGTRPAVAEGEAPPPAAPGPGVHRKAFVIAMVPIAVTAAVLVGGSHTPARAAACPEGLPSRSVAATTSAPKSATKSPDSLGKAVTPKKKASTASTAKQSATPSPSASAGAGDDDEESDHPILDGIKNGVGDIVDGVGKLLGIGDDPTETPSPDPSPTTGAPTPSAPAPTSGQPVPSGSATPGPGGSGTPSGSASPSPTPTSSDVPCLGPRVLGKVAGPDDLPTVAVKPGLLEGDKLTMYNSTYDGVSTLTTTKGTFKALKFSMTKAVTEPFSLTIDEAGSAHTVIKSNQLTIEDRVRFYTTNFQGKLFGLIPVTFTPEQPPPLTLPVLWFTDVKIQLAFVRCDTLTADPLKITEPA